MDYSPLDGVRIPRDLVCHFFSFFARMEFALKEQGFAYAQGRGNYAAPDWNGFAAAAGQWLTVAKDSELAGAIAYLMANPPKVQRWPGLHWENDQLRGETNNERAIHAACRVRHNLFHGGKHGPHSPDGHDERLVRASLSLLEACVVQEPNGLRATFEGH